MNELILGVRPYPKPTESLNGYLLRLAYLNGLQSVFELLDAIGMEKPKIRRYGIWAEHERIALSAALRKVLNRTFDASVFPDQQNRWWFYDENCWIKEIRLDIPRLCMTCWKDQPKMDWRWGMGTIARCDIHKEHLLDSCPQCSQSFKWQTSLYKGCTECGFTWSQMQENPTTSGDVLSEFEKALYPDVNGNIAASSEQLRTVCESLIKTARPEDLMWQTLQRIPDCTHHSELLLAAIASVGIPEAKSSHFERFEYLRPARQRLSMRRDVKAFRRHINHQGLAEVLSMSKSDLLTVTECQVFPKLNSTNIVRDQIFDIRGVYDFLSCYTTPIPNDEWELITSKTKALRKNLTTYGQLLSDVLKGNVRGYLPEARNCSAIRIDKPHFQDWLKARFDAECANPLTKAAVARVLDCSSIEVNDYVKSGCFRWARWQQYGERVDGESFRDYIASSNCRQAQ